MQALFALKKIVSTFAGGRPSFCRPHYFLFARIAEGVDWI